jgi:predicted phage-related endonuclease
MPNIPVPDEATWHSLRDSHIGGSDIASLFYQWRHADGSEAVYHIYEIPPTGSEVIGCLSPHTTGYRLWQEKAGVIAPDAYAANERVQAGNHLEPALASWAQEKWDWKLRKVRRYCTHPTVKGWGASLDYEAVESGMPPVEFKNVDFLIYRDKWVEEDGEIVMPPLNYVLQLQHQIGAVEADHGWIVACIGGNKLVRGRIAAHAPTQARIAEAVAQFWIGVREKVEPTWIADYGTVAEVYRYGEAKAVADLTSDDEVPALCAEYREAKAVLNDAEARVENVKGRLAAKVGEAGKATAKGYRISWPVIERAEKIIPERIQKALTYRGALTVTAAKEE